MGEYRTAKLWIYVHEHGSVFSDLMICSARTGNWKLYIQSLHEMLPYLAAAGHNNYVKSLVLYLQKLDELVETHPAVYNQFMEGRFVLYRSNNHWAGIFSDLFIEQVLMESIKSVGELTRGRGFQESTRLTWLLSMPACGEVHKAMQEVTNLSNTDVSHKDLCQARLKHDANDLQKILDYLDEKQPFSKSSHELRSLSSGVMADTSVNVDSAVEVGSAILASMEGLSVSNHKLLTERPGKQLGFFHVCSH